MANIEYEYGPSQGGLFVAGSTLRGMIDLSRDEMARLEDYVNRNFGIDLSQKQNLVQGRLNNYLMQRGFCSYTEYLARLFSDTSGAEAEKLMELLTTNYSYFMRETDHFDFLKRVALPEFMRKITDHDLRIWSAGCSTGEEPYGLAMLIGEFFGMEKVTWDSKILATDISNQALAAANAGIYSADAVKSIPPQWRSTNFAVLPSGQYQVKRQLKDEIIFRKFNLMQQQDFPFKKKFHVIFCRNVMIYFDAESRNRLVRRFYQALEPGGYLFIGHSEFIDRGEHAFSFVRPSIFQKRDE